MSDPLGVAGLDDILYDIEGTRKAEGRTAGFFAGEEAALRGRITARTVRGTTRGSAEPGVGRRLLAGCPDTTRRRYQTLLYFEEKLPPDSDHGYLIGPACQILESELDRLVLTPARGIAASLVAALQVARKDRPQSEILEKWAGGQIPTTIGIGSLVLLALRRGREQRLVPILEFLTAGFDPVYDALLCSNGLARCLDAIRTKFRNPTCHGTAVFDADAYGEFTQMVVANRRFAHWDRSGPIPPDPDAGVGFLHHHLYRVRSSGPEPHLAADGSPGPEPDGPLARLLALRSPVSAALAVHLAPHLASASRSLREITITPARLDRAFRLGDTIRLGVQATADCHIALLDLGTSGAVTVIWPNLERRQTWIDGGRPHFLPAIEAPEFDLVLTGRKGRERVVAIATLAPLGRPLLPEPGTAFRSLTADEIGQIADALEGAATPWAVASCAFEIDE